MTSCCQTPCFFTEKSLKAHFWPIERVTVCWCRAVALLSIVINITVCRYCFKHCIIFIKLHSNISHSYRRSMRCIYCHCREWIQSIYEIDLEALCILSQLEVFGNSARVSFQIQTDTHKIILSRTIYCINIMH